MTIFKKSMITLGAAVLVFTTIFVVSVMVFMNSLYYEINMNGLENTAKSLMTAIGKERIAEIFSENTGVFGGEYSSLPVSAAEEYRVTLIAPSGYVLWDSHVTERLVNHIDREEVIAALEGREGSSRRESISTNIRRIYYALPVFDNDNNVTGVFRLSLSIPEFGVRISPIIVPFLLFIYFFIFAAFSAILMFSRSLSSSLERLVNIAQTSAKLISPQTAPQVAPEFLSLENALRIMADELHLRFEQGKAEGSRLEAILGGMSEAVFAMDSDLKLHLINPKARELFNLENRDIKTMTLLEATRSAELAEIAKKAVSTGSPVETELTFHSGAQQYFQVYASPSGAGQDGEHGSQIGVVLVLQEITQLVKLARIRKDFVANVSHELRTPIQLIKGFSETLLDSVADKKYLRFIEIIRKNAETMENLTNDLLILAGLENGNFNLRDMEECSIASLIIEAVSSVEPQARKKQMEIIVNCEENLRGKLFGSLIVQALINLLDNGIKYSQKKSKLWISAAYTGDQTLLLEVRDKGIGIPSEHLDRIFERFYRVDRARSRYSGNSASDSGGTGLGLSIVRHIALLHNGIAEAESHAGEGSIFRISIPS